MFGMIGYTAAVAVSAMVDLEGRYQELCEAAKAAGGVPPNREEYFGKPMQWDLPERRESDKVWWSLGLAILIGSMF